MMDANNSKIILKALLLRIILIGFYLLAMRRISLLTRCVKDLIDHPYLLSIIISECKLQVKLRYNALKPFLLILAFIKLTLPIFKTLVRDVTLNSVFWIFSLSQIIFCLDSVKSSILNTNKTKRKFKRSDVIPLEEGILIPLKHECNGIMGNIAAIVGSMATMLMLESELEMLVLQAIGFLMYIFFPVHLERKLVHIVHFKLICFTASFLIFAFIDDFRIFLVFLYLISAVSVSIQTIIKIIE